MKTQAQAQAAKTPKVYIKAVDIAKAAYANGGVRFTAFQVMIDYKDGNLPTTAAAAFGGAAVLAAHNYTSAKAEKKSGATIDGERKNAESARAEAVELGKKKARRTAAIVAAAKVAEIIGGKLADKLAEELESARAAEVEWKAAEDKAAAARRAKYAETHAAEIAAKQLAAEKKARAILGKAQAQAEKIRARYNIVFNSPENEI